MKNVLRIFVDDVKHGVGNSLAVVVLVGLMLLPAMYAWFNDAASWDPYHHTEGLKVAVATQDEGYKSDLLPVAVNIGDMVESELRSNSTFDWQFVSSDDAIEGVKSGKYYAALVLPSTFSSDMMSVFNENAQTAHIDYYVNEKINPIASHVTDVGADTVQESIRTAFSGTVADVGLSLLDQLSAYGSSGNLQAYAERVGARIDTSVQDARGAADSVRALGNLVGAVNTLVDSSSSVMEGAGATSQSAKDAISDASSSLGDATQSLDGVTDRVNDALSASSDSFDALRDQSDAAFDALDTSAGDASAALRTVSGKVDDQRAAFKQVRDAMADLGFATDEIDGVISSLDTASSALSQSADRIDAGVTDASASRQEVRDAVDAAKGGVTQLKGSYEHDLKSQVDALKGSLSTVASSSDDVSQQLSATADSLSRATGSLSDRLGATKSALDGAATTLDGLADQLAGERDALRDAVAAGDFSKVKDLVGDDSTAIANFLAAPVQMDRNAVYAMANNGSSMASFYTMLTLWVGAVILAVMLQTHLSPARRVLYPNLKPREAYFGRFGIFSLLLFGQSLTVCLGDVYFLQIQCVDPVRFVLTGVIVGQCFGLFVYTLVLSFGNIGKAISVILLVMQVAGAGGIFPIELSAPFFQGLYPYLPFVHGMRAMQACIAGAYGHEWAFAMVAVSSLVAISFVLAFVIRKPIMRLMRYADRKLAETKLM